MKQDWTDKIKDKMDGYTETPSGRVWDGISSRISSGSAAGTRSRIIPPCVWKSSAAAAAVMAGVFLTFKVNDEGNTPLTASTTPIAVQESETAEPTEDGDISIDIKSGRTIPAHGHRYLAQAKTVGASADYGRALSEDIDTEEIPEKNSEPESQEIESAPRQKKAMVTEESREESEAEAWARYLSEEEPGKRKRSGKFSAGISANGSGRGSSSESRQMSGVMGANPLESGVASADWVDKDFKNIIVYNKPETETTYSHKMPVRISATARYEFLDMIGVESGISWTVLSSELKTGSEGIDGNWTRGEQTLHYIGIPLNLSVKLYESRFFTAYLTAGGMMEKAVRGTLKTDEYIEGKFIETSSSTIRPKEMQWSVNAAAGAQLNILPRLGLFVEPGVSHRFSNGSDIRSAYTDKPTDFSLGFGLRYSFK